MKRKFKSVLIFTAVCIIFSTVVAFATAGDSNDPLITLSYITDVLLPDIDSRINTKIEAVSGGTASQPAGESQSFVLVNVDAGSKLIGHAGTELVLRSGTGTIIAGTQGGVADLTAGMDLINGNEVPKNHLLLIPRSDMRGIAFSTNGIVMVKGSYEISKN